MFSTDEEEKKKENKRKETEILWIVLTEALFPSKSKTGNVLVCTWYSLSKHSIVCISTNWRFLNVSHVFWTCSMHGENEQNLPPEILSKKK